MQRGARCCRMWQGVQLVAVRCSVMRCVAAWCGVLQCGAVCCSVVQCVAEWCSAFQSVAVCCIVVQIVAVWCSVMQCDTVWCSMIQCAAVCCSISVCAWSESYHTRECFRLILMWHVNACSNEWMSIHMWISLSDVVMSNTWMRHVPCINRTNKSCPMYGWVMSRIWRSHVYHRSLAPALQRTATLCNTLPAIGRWCWRCMKITHCITLQHAATHCITVQQHTAT